MQMRHGTHLTGSWACIIHTNNVNYPANKTGHAGEGVNLSINWPSEEGRKKRGANLHGPISSNGREYDHE
jgi:hypothetical protein